MLAVKCDFNKINSNSKEDKESKGKGIGKEKAVGRGKVVIIFPHLHIKQERRISQNLSFQDTLGALFFSFSYFAADCSLLFC